MPFSRKRATDTIYDSSSDMVLLKLGLKHGYNIAKD
jgi:hypothetical protein